MTKLARIAAGLTAEIDAGCLPGAVLKVVHRGRVLVDLAFGRCDPHRDVPMTGDAIFRIYSMAKPLVSVAALMLMEEGRLHLADPVAAWLPDFAAMPVVAPDGGTVPALRPIRLHDLGIRLLHRPARAGGGTGHRPDAGRRAANPPPRPARHGRYRLRPRRRHAPDRIG